MTSTNLLALATGAVTAIAVLAPEGPFDSAAAVVALLLITACYVTFFRYLWRLKRGKRP